MKDFCFSDLQYVGNGWNRFRRVITNYSRENCIILTITDLFSKWTEAYALPDKPASSVVLALVNLFCNKGIPQAVLSDNGSEFCNEVRKL